MSDPYSLKIFLPHGEPDGVRVLSKSGWSGVGMVVPRSRLTATMRERAAEFDATGIYVLTGIDEGGGLPWVYAGEGSPVADRLRSHHTGTNQKDFWDRCVFFTSTDGTLNKAHVQRVEARLVGLADKAKRCVLQNVSRPTLPRLHEAEVADAEAFLREVLQILPLVGIDAFEVARRRTVALTVPTEALTGDAAPPEVPGTLRLRRKGVDAAGEYGGNSFLLLAGSTLVSHTSETATCPDLVRRLRRELIETGVVAADPSGVLTTTADYEFNSPSLAAAVVLGASSNGRELWVDDNGRSLNELEAEAAEEADLSDEAPVVGESP